MSTTDAGTDTQEPLRVSILAQRGYLVASIHTALDDSQLVRFQRDLMEQIGWNRARGVIIDVAALDVIDSFASHTLRSLAAAARLRGAQTVVVGIQPSVAIAMATWGLALEPAHTALDLEEGTALLDDLVGR
ncbi:STAS domain-containing protein [Pseudonocardia charpentierae]|uniref:STAS domain-containing protein n=1 Tax=Pseudonocardia charpentierae TaxID=3075545 RepID=A0ABU2NH95_9PSEU|nr:STAS domain-containing protein [Pseudonocardia sp. DSM 45834]MDT0353316.1 STAS domain-containing protein [Pseudonocardia sp. DSM 45834]